MKLFKKTFLFLVGVVTLAFDEVALSIEKAIQSVEEQRHSLRGRFE